MVGRIGGGPRIEMPEFEPVEAPLPPPPPAPVAPPNGFGDDSSFNPDAAVQPLPTQNAAAFSGKLDVQFEYQGQTQPIQLTVNNGVLSADGKEVGRVTGTRPDGRFELELLGKPAVGTLNVPLNTAMQAQQGDMKPFPSGAPETYVKPLYGGEVNRLEADRQQMIDTVVAAVPAEKQAEVRKLLETGGPDLAKTPVRDGEELISAGVSEGSLRKAFEQVLEARKSPGTKDLKLELTPQRTTLGPDQSTSESGSNVRATIVEDGQPLKLSFKVQVDAKGAVNGAALPIDESTRLRTELTKVSPDLKEEALKRAGFDGEWLQRADRDQRDVLLAKLRQATLTPGEHTIDVGYDEVTSNSTSESGGPDTVRHIDGKVTFTVDEKGNVNGKPLYIETALATSRVMEQLPMAEKRAMLERLGFKPEDLKPLSADRATDILARVAMKTLEPGQHSLEVDTGPDKFAIALKVSEKGELEGSGVTKLPPPPKKKSFFSKIIGPILTVVSIAFPVTAPFIRIAQAGLAIANGAKGLSLVGSVLGAAAGVADIAGSALSGALNTAASVVNNVNGAVQGIKNGDYLGAFSSAISLAGAAGSVAQGSALANLGTLASAGSAIRSGNYGGLFSIALNAFKEQTGGTSNTPRPDATDTDGPEQLSGPGAPGPAAVDDDDGPLQLSGPGAPTTPVSDDDGPLQLGGPTDPDEPEQLGGPTGTEPTDGPSSPIDTSPLTAPPVTVVRGDTLTSLARDTVGLDRLPELYAWNAGLIGGNPNLLKPGQELQMPPDGFTLSNEERAQFYALSNIPRPAADVDRPNEPVGDTSSATGPVSTSGGAVPFDPNAGDGDYGSLRTEMARLTLAVQDAEARGEEPGIIKFLKDTAASAKLKIELGAGTKKLVYDINLDGKSTLKIESALPKLLGGNLGPLKGEVEPTFSVDANGTLVLEVKANGSVGPAEAGFKLEFNDKGEASLKPYSEVNKDLTGLGFDVLGLRFKLGLEAELGGPNSTYLADKTFGAFDSLVATARDALTGRPLTEGQRQAIQARQRAYTQALLRNNRG